MNFDDNTKKRLLSLSDDEFRALIGAICDAAGADSTKAAMFKSNISGIKNAISGMSSADAERLMQSIGKDKAEDIARILRSI